MSQLRKPRTEKRHASFPRAFRHWLMGLTVLSAQIGAAQTTKVSAVPNPVSVASPSGDIEFKLELSPVTGTAEYRVVRKGEVAVENSGLGLSFAEGGAVRGLSIQGVEPEPIDDQYILLAGKASSIHARANGLLVHLQESAGLNRQIDVECRAYDDGVAFRYRLPAQPNLQRFTITSEDTQFNLPLDAEAWSLPLKSFTTPYEAHYENGTIRQLGNDQLIGLPLLVHRPNGPWLGITEANLVDYAGCYLLKRDGVLTAALSPLPGKSRAKVIASTPHDSPWRVITFADEPAQLIESNLVTDVSDPCALSDTSWIHPGKICFLWWNGYQTERGQQGGMDTETIEKYIDFAAENRFPYASIDGFDHAWYGGPNAPYEGADITRAVRDVNIPEIFEHARQKNVRMRVWVHSRGLMKYFDQALPLYEKWGVEGLMVDFVERDDQEMVNWLHTLVAKAAERHMTVTLHNVSKPTGLSRTYPNLLTYESVLNLEYNKWSSRDQASTPEHEVTVPFVRMLAGPLDFHTGGFRSVLPADFRPRDLAPVVMGTRCHQLAMYVVYENPLPMIADSPGAYRDQPGFDLLRDVPTTWDQTHAVGGAVGQWIILARQKSGVWYVGGMAGDQAAVANVKLDFLSPGNWSAESWTDRAGRDPNLLDHVTRAVKRDETIPVSMSAAGGFVIKISPITSAAGR